MFLQEKPSKLTSLMCVPSPTQTISHVAPLRRKKVPRLFVSWPLSALPRQKWAVCSPFGHLWTVWVLQDSKCAGKHRICTIWKYYIHSYVGLWLRQESNPGPSCCEATVLNTAPLCRFMSVINGSFSAQTWNRSHTCGHVCSVSLGVIQALLTFLVTSCFSQACPVLTEA